MVYRLLQTIGKTDDEMPGGGSFAHSDIAGGAQVIDIPIVAEEVVTEETATSRPELAAVYRKIHKADPDFTESFFVQGAKLAYEMVLEAFAKGDHSQLKELLNHSLYLRFAAEIDRRKVSSDYAIFTLVTLKSCKVLEAKVEAGKAQIKVEFVSEQMCTQYRVEQEPSHRSMLQTDQWTFMRDLKSNKPDWLLIATE